MTQDPQTFSFEQAYSRLEQILERMNSGKATLDESLALYEEADKLISFCGSRLNQAEQKIEMLIKNRSGALAVGADNKPQMQEFSTFRPS